MSYIVLARKYRPKNFDDVIGQDAIVTTLKNAISSDRIAHAYLFSGPRGVGKTSLARIFSKALNATKGPTTNIPKDCPICEDIDQGRSLDVIEIDGASNRGIEDIRAIRENIKFAPSQGKFKIYIIDEVHQITQDGFNALLKTLEEPPSHAKFIFATTSPEKIPATILSRCQRFDFKRISTETIAGTLEAVAKKEKLNISSDALYEIARAADGSLRDSQSLLDQISSYSKKKIGVDEVSEALGVVHQEKFVQLFNAIANKDSEFVLNHIDEIFKTGKDSIHFLERCLEHVRNLLVVHAKEDYSSLIDAQESYKKLLKEQSKSFSKEDLFYIFSVLNQGIQNAKRLRLKRVAVEMALLKCVLREPMVLLKEDLLKDSKGSENSSKPKNKKTSQKSSSVSEATDHTSNGNLEKSEKNLDSSNTEEGQEDNFDTSLETEKNDFVNLNTQDLKKIWTTLVSQVRNEKISAASYMMEAEPVECKDNTFIIGFPLEFSFHAEALASDDNLTLLRKHLASITSKEMNVKFILQGDADGEEDVAKQEDDPMVRSTMDILGGRLIKQ